MTSNTRAQRLVDEFEEGAAFAGGGCIRHGIAAVLYGPLRIRQTLKSTLMILTMCIRCTRMDAMTLLQRFLKLPPNLRPYD
jgi:hypothetical protein